MFKFKEALNASQSEAGWTQMPHFRTIVFALSASTPFYTFEIRDLFKPDSLVQPPVTHQHRRPATEAQALWVHPPSSLGFSGFCSLAAFRDTLFDPKRRLSRGFSHGHEASQTHSWGGEGH